MQTNIPLDVWNQNGQQTAFAALHLIVTKDASLFSATPDWHRIPLKVNFNEECPTPRALKLLLRNQTLLCQTALS